MPIPKSLTGQTLQTKLTWKQQAIKKTRTTSSANLRKSRWQPRVKSAALSRFSRCAASDDFRDFYNFGSGLK